MRFVDPEASLVVDVIAVTKAGHDYAPYIQESYRVSRHDIFVGEYFTYSELAENVDISRLKEIT